MINRNRYQKTRNFTYYLKTFLTLALFATSPFYWVLPVLADTTPGTTIDNTATGSFEDPDDLGNVKTVESNTVSVTVAEVAGITITQSATPEEAPSGVTGAGANQGDGSINPDDVIYFTYQITNVGNDPTQFFIPDAPSSITNGSLSGSIEIIEYDPDGASAVDLTSNNITVPTNGATTGTLLNGVNNTNDGSIPVGGSITIRVPVKADSTLNDGDTVTAVMGDVPPNDNSAATQNQVYAAGTNDVYTQDNPDGTTGETNGNPINGDATNRRQEASLRQEVNVAIANGTPILSCAANETLMTFRWDRFLNTLDLSSLVNASGPTNFTSPEIYIGGHTVTLTLINPNQYTSNRPSLGNSSSTFSGNSTESVLEIVGQWGRSSPGTPLQATLTFDPPLGDARFDIHDLENNANNSFERVTLEASLGAASKSPTALTTSSSDVVILAPNVAQGQGPNPAGQKNPDSTASAFYDGLDTITFNFDTTNFSPDNTGVGIGAFELCGRPGDFSDAPISGTNYGVAVHQVVSGIQLGSSVDSESNELSSADATGDNTDGSNDEDGVSLAGNNLQGQSLTAGDTVTLDIPTAGSGVLNAWIDWNGDGDFADANEQIATDADVSGGTLSVSVPSGATVGTTYARFRYSSQTGLTPTGAANDGEVEDYQVEIAAAAATPIPANACPADARDLINLTFDPSKESYESGPTAFQVGHVRRFAEIGTVDGQNLDLLIEIVAITNNQSNQLRVLEARANGSVVGSMEGNNNSFRNDPIGTIRSFELKYTFVQTGTTTPVPTSFEVELGDIDHIVKTSNETGSRREFIQVSSADIDAFFFDNSTNLVATAINGGTGIEFFNQDITTTNPDSIPENAVKLLLRDTSSFNAVYGAEKTRGDAAIGNTGFVFDSTVISLLGKCPRYDYGDAPDTGSGTGAGNYETLVENGGAYHQIVDGIYLGAAVPDADNNGTPTTNADGDDNSASNSNFDDEDGISLAGNDLQGQSLTAGSTVDLDIAAAGNGVLNAWIDWNGDGDFADANEQIATDADVSGGTLSVNVPAGAILGTTYARFRYSTQTGLTPTGAASDGEVEDYQVEIAPNYEISPAAGQVIINEVLYNETGNSAAANDEFIEIYNASNTPVDLSNWKLLDGNLTANDTDNAGSINGSSGAYEFPSGTTLQPGEYAVIWVGTEIPDRTASGAAFQTWLGNAPKLNNTGDDMWLYDSEDKIVDYIAYGSGGAINTIPPASLNLWDSTNQPDLAGATDGQSISLTRNGVDGNTSICWEPTTSGNAQTQGCSNYLPTIDSDTVGSRVTSVGENNNGTPEVLLIKRITRINNQTTNPNDNTTRLDTFVDDTTSTRQEDDNNPNWENNYLIGAIDAGPVKPGDEVEYTIYFLSSGTTPAKSVLFCDRVPGNVSFIPDSFNSEANRATGGLQNADRGILWSKDGNTQSLTNDSDGDVAQYFSLRNEPTTVYPRIQCDGANENGAIVVDLKELPNATAPGTPNTSYGLIRFRGRVK